jgi:hypothetical protein
MAGPWEQLLLEFGFFVSGEPNPLVSLKHNSQCAGQGACGPQFVVLTFVEVLGESKFLDLLTHKC